MFETFINIFETGLLTWFLYEMTDKKESKVTRFSLTILYFTIDYIFISFINQFFISENLLTLIELSFTSLYVYYLSDSITAERTFFIASIPLNVIGIENVIQIGTLCFLLYHKFDYMRLMTEYRVPEVLLAQAIHFLIFYYIIKIKKKMTLRLSKQNYILLAILFFICNGMSMCFESVMLKYENSEIYMLAGIYLIILFVVFLAYLYRSIYNQTLAKEKLELRLKISEHDKKTSEKVFSAQKELYKLRHDMKHFIQGLKAIDKGDNEELTRTIAAYDSMVNEELVPFKTRSSAINYVLDIKRDEALRKGIHFRSRIHFMHDLLIKDDDLFLLLSNILDNAISHIGMQKDLYVEIFDYGRLFIIRISNSIDLYVLKNGELNITDDSREDTHGFGAMTIRSICSNYEGSAFYQEEDHTFITTVTFPFSTVVPENYHE